EKEEQQLCSSSSPANNSSTLKSKECTWCKKHHPTTNYKGHSWHECNKLKKHNEEKKKSKDSGSEQAHVTTGNDDKVRHLPYTFDTGASSRMPPYLEDFEHLSLCTGSINSSSSHSLKVEGKGSVVIENVLRDGSV